MPSDPYEEILSGSYGAPAPKPRRVRGTDPTVPKIVDEELSSLGWTPSARQAMLGNLGRENAWNRDIIFSGHKDPANNENNLGIISWQKDRRTKLLKYMGNDLTPSDDNLRKMARFLDDEMKGSPEWQKTHSRMRDPNLTVDEAYPLLQKYIKYQPRYEGANKTWTKRAQSLGLGQQDIYEQILSGQSSQKPADTPLTTAPEQPTVPPTGQPPTTARQPQNWSDAEESKFREWYAPIAAKNKLDPNPDDARHQYDYRSAFRAGATPGTDGHWPSKFKLAGHPNRYVDGVDTITGQSVVGRESAIGANDLEWHLGLSPDYQQFLSKRAVRRLAKLVSESKAADEERRARGEQVAPLTPEQQRANRQRVGLPDNLAPSWMVQQGMKAASTPSPTMADVSRRDDAILSRKYEIPKITGRFSTTPAADIAQNVTAPYTGPPRGAAEGVGTPSTMERATSGLNSVTQKFVYDAPASVLEAIAIASSFNTGNPMGQADATKNPAYQLATAIREAGQYYFPTDERLRDEFFNTKVPEALGSGFSFLTGGGAIGNLIKAPKVATALLGISSGMSSGYRDAKAHNATEEQAMWSALLNGGVGASEVVGVGSIISRIDKLSGGSFKRAMLNAGKETFEEAVQEFFQTTAGNAVAKKLYQQDRALFEGTGSSAGAGGFTGALLSIITSAALGRRAKISPTTQTEVQPNEITDTGETPVQTPIPSGASTGAPQATSGLRDINVKPTVPEKAETLEAQVRALREGKRDAVLVTEGEQMPTPPPGYATTKTPLGTFIHDPKELLPADVRRGARRGTYTQWLNIVDPSAHGETQTAVVARDDNGTELQASEVRDETIQPQAEVMREQFPQASVAVEPTESVIAGRTKQPWQMTRKEWRDSQFNEDEHRYLPDDYFGDEKFFENVKLEGYPNLLGKVGQYEIRRSKDGAMLGVFLDGETVGYADKNAFNIKPEHQRQGIGTVLLQQIRAIYPDHRIGNQTSAGSGLMMSYHLGEVRNALDRGEAVPSEVLADYPELKSAQPTADSVGRPLDWLEYDEAEREAIRRNVDAEESAKSELAQTFDEFEAQQPFGKLPTAEVETTLSDNIAEPKQSERVARKNLSLPQLIAQHLPVPARRMFGKAKPEGYTLNHDTEMWEYRTEENTPVHHSQNQPRRVRRTKTGMPGQFKAGKVQPDAIDQILAGENQSRGTIGTRESNVQTTTTSTTAERERSQAAVLDRRRAEIPTTRPAKGQTVAGKKAQVRIAGTQRSLDVQYAVREASDVYPSHNPQTFQPNTDYHFTNDRRYDKEKQYQQQVMGRSSPEQFDPAQVINNSSTIDTGMPVTDVSGNVLGGNSRSMMLHRIYASDNPTMRDAYRAKLIEDAALYGVLPDDIRGMKAPVLVREVSDDSLDAQQIISDLNKTSTTPLTQKERAVAEAKNIPSETLVYIAGKFDALGADATLNDVLVKFGPDIVNRLIADGVLPEGERNALIENGELTVEAKQRLQRMYRGLIFSDLEQMGRVQPSTMQVLDRIIAPVIQTSVDPEWSILEPLRESVDFLQAAKTAKQANNLDDFAKQQSFTRPEGWGEKAVALGNALNQKPTSAARAFRQYANEFQNAKDGGGLFGSVSPQQAFESLVGAPAESLKMARAEQTDTPEPLKMARVGEDKLLTIAKSYPSTEAFAKDYEILYHGGSEKILGDKLVTGGRVAGEVTEANLGKGQDYGGLFFTPEKELANTFVRHAPGGRGAVHTFVVKKDGLFDETKALHRAKLKNFIGKEYTDIDGERVVFDQQMYDFIFPMQEDRRRHMDWATFDPQIIEALGFEGARVIENYDADGKGKHLISTVLFQGGKDSPHWLVAPDTTLKEVYDAAQRGESLKMSKKADEAKLRAVKDDTDLVSGIESRVSDNIVFISPAAMEMMRRVEAEDAASFDAQFLEPERRRQYVRTLRKGAASMRAANYPAEQAAKLDKLASDIAQAGRAGKRNVVVALSDEYLAHEFLHLGSYTGAEGRALSDRHRPTRLKELRATKAANGWYELFKNMPQYHNASPALVVEETAAFLANGNYERLGISKDEATVYLRQWYQSYVERNGVQSLSNFRRQRNEVKQIIAETMARYGRKPAEGRPASEGVQSVSEEQGQAGKGARGSPAESSDEEIRIAAEVANISESDERLKNRQFGETLRKWGRDAEDVSYIPDTEAGWLEGAEDVLSRGTDEALKAYKAMSPRETLKPVLGVLLADRLGAEGRYTEQQKLYQETIELTGNAGARLRATQTVSIDDPAYASAAAGLLKSKAIGKPLTEKEAQDAYNIAVAGQNARDNQVEIDARVKEFENQKLELEARLKEFEIHPAIAANLKTENERLKKQIEALKENKPKPLRHPSQRALLKTLEAEESDLVARLKARYNQPATSLKMARPTKDVDGDLVNYAKLLLLRNLSKGTYSPTDLQVELDTITKLSDAEFKQVVGNAYAQIKATPSPISSEARQSRANRKEFEKIQKEVAPAQGPAKPDALARAVYNLNPSPEVLYGSLLYRTVQNSTDWRKLVKEAYPQADLRKTFRESKESLDEARKATRRERLEIKAEKKLTDEEYIQAREEQKEARLHSVQARQNMQRYYMSLTKSKARKILDQVLDILAAPRAVLASNDASFGGRQGLIPLITETKITAEALAEALPAYISEKNYADLVEEARLHPNFKIAQRYGAKFAAIGDNPFELGSEFFASRLAEKYPGVKRSERLYTLQGDLTILSNFSKSKELIDEDVSLDAEQKHEAYKSVLDFLNISVGKGNFAHLFGHGGAIEAILNLFGFAPRFRMSRFQALNYMLNPIKLARLPYGARKITIKKAMRANLTFVSVLAPLALLGLVGLDPEDKEHFLVLRIGEHKFDFLGGLKEPFRLTAGLGIKMSIYALMAGAGKAQGNQDWIERGTIGMARVANEYDLSNKSGGARSFLRSGLSPIASSAVNLKSGTDITGKPTTLWGEATRNAFPIIAQQAWDSFTYDRKEQMMHEPDTYQKFREKVSKIAKGEFNKNIASTIPATLVEAIGVGTSKYPERKYSTALKTMQFLDGGGNFKAKDPERSRIERGLKDRLFAGEDHSSLLAEAQEYVRQGKLQDDDIKQFEKLKGQTRLTDKASRLDTATIEKALRFGTPEEREQMQPTLRLKEARAKDDAIQDERRKKNFELKAPSAADKLKATDGLNEMFEVYRSLNPEAQSDSKVRLAIGRRLRAIESRYGLTEEEKTLVKELFPNFRISKRRARRTREREERMPRGISGL